MSSKITPFLWFDANLEEAMEFYVSIFKNSKIVNMSRIENAGPESTTVVTGTFQLDGQEFMALSGGPFHFTEAISLYVNCKTQQEVDELWDKLLEGGGEPSQCGWLKDKYGLSWQIIPTALGEMLGDKDPEKAGRVMRAMLQMQKIDVAALERAYAQD